MQNFIQRGNIYSAVTFHSPKDLSTTNFVLTSGHIYEVEVSISEVPKKRFEKV